MVVAADTLVRGRRGRDLVAEVAHAGDLHVGLAHGAGAAGEVLVQRRRLWHPHVLERLGEARRRLPVAVRRLDLVPQRERLVARALTPAGQGTVAERGFVVAEGYVRTATRGLGVETE